MGIVFKNNAKTTLASSLSNSATSATVTDGSVFPSLSAGEFFLITFDDGTNNEICKCTARSGNTLTIVRAQESTTARAFSSGDAAEGRVTAGVLETIQENIAAKSANQTVYNTTTASSATDYDIGIDPSVEANAMVFLNGVMQHHDTFSFSGSTLTFDAAPPNGMALEVIVDNLINLQSSNLTVDTFTATSGQTDFVLSDTPAAETNLIVFVDGVFQDQDSYTISNNTLTITDGVVLNRGVTVYVINPVNIGTPSDGTVTSAKLSGNITMPGTLTVGSNDVAFDSPTFVVDNANSRVGLGTASPSVPVDIVGDVKMSANLTVDTSTLHVDSTNNRVGIGTDSPDEPLHIFSTTDADILLEGTEAGTSTRFAKVAFANNISGTTTDLGAITADTDGATNSSAFKFYTANAGSVSEKMVIKSDGNVGIATSSPAAKLDVSGVFQFFDDTTPEIKIVDSDDNNYALVGYSDGTMTLSSNHGNEAGGADVMQFLTGGLERWNIDSSGHFTGATDSKIIQTISSGGGNFLEVTHSGNEAWSMAVQSGTGVDDYLDIGINGGTRAISIHEDGKVGIGVTNPSSYVDDNNSLVVAGQVRIEGVTNSAGSPLLALADNNSGLYSPSANVIGISTAGVERMRIDGNKVYFGNQSTVASSGYIQKLTSPDYSFNIYASSSTTTGRNITFNTNANTEAMRIDSGNALHIGTTAQPGGGWDAHLNVAHDTNAAYFRSTGSGGSAGVGIQVGTYTATTYALVFYNGQQGAAGGVSLANANTSTSVAYNTSSDYRMKENIRPIENGLDRLKQLKPVKFDWKTSDETSEGFIAHEVQEIFPDAIAGEKDGEEMQGMDYGRITPLLVKAIQEQQAQIETLKQEIREIRESG